MSLALHYWMGDVHHCSGPPVSEMTYTVSSGTLNPSIPYRLNTYDVTYSFSECANCPGEVITAPFANQRDTVMQWHVYCVRQERQRHIKEHTQYKIFIYEWASERITLEYGLATHIVQMASSHCTVRHFGDESFNSSLHRYTNNQEITWNTKAKEKANWPFSQPPPSKKNSQK